MNFDLTVFLLGAIIGILSYILVLILVVSHHSLPRRKDRL